MCITFFCLEPASNQAVKLILGFNREEQTERKTLSLHQFQEDKNIYAGKDLISGGTWLGINIETGILVVLTNYDLQIFRYGLSRGQLVLSFLKTQFISKQHRSESDLIIEDKLKTIAKSSQKYSPFNLTVINLRTRKAFYICSERNTGTNIPVELKKRESHGICNSDIETVWPKTALGLSMFNSFINNLGQLDESQMLMEMVKIFKNRQRFSEVDDDESSIFVEPYFCKAQKAERRTKTSLFLILKELEENYQILLKETTYSGVEMNESEIVFRLKMQK